MGTELDFNFNYDKAKQRQIKRNQTGSVGSSGSSDVTTSQVNNLINSALQDYEESHPIPDPVTPNTTLLGTIEGDSLTDAELRSLVWHDEFNNGQFDPEKWHKTTYGNPPLYADGYTTENGIYLKDKGISFVGRLISRQAFRNCTIKVRAKRLSLWFGTMLFDSDSIPGGDEIFYQEIDYCEKYNIKNDNKVYCNLHNVKLDKENNAVRVESQHAAITGHNFYADDNWHDMELVISAPDATTGAISVTWKLDGTTVATKTMNRQNLSADATIDQTIARQGIKIVLDRALGAPYNEAYEMPVIDYVRVFSNSTTAYKEAAELGYITPDGKLAPLQKGYPMFDFMSTDAIQELPASQLSSLQSMGLDEAHMALVTAINSGDIYNGSGNKTAASAVCCPPRAVALPLDAPVVPEFKYVDAGIVYEKNKKDALMSFKFRGGDIRIGEPVYDMSAYDIKKTIFSWGGDFYKIFAVRSFVGKLNYQANWTETSADAEGYIQNKPS